MDYSRNYFSISILIFFTFTTICLAAPQTMQDIETEMGSETVDERQLLDTTSNSEDLPSTTVQKTGNGGLLFTAPTENEHDLSTEDSSSDPPISVPVDKSSESSLSSLPGSETESDSTSSDSQEVPSATESDENSSDELKTTTTSSTSKDKPPEVTNKPEGSSSSHKRNGSSTVAPVNGIGLCLIVFLSRSFLLKT